MNENLMRLTQPDDVGSYRRIMCRFMSWLHDKPYHFTPNGQVVGDDVYPVDRHFTNDELLAIRPVDICHWLCLLAYHDEDPDPATAHPVYASMHTLLYHKKALSYYMLQSHSDWDEATNFGNPTKSRLVNKITNLVKKEETAGNGKPSSADRPFEEEEMTAVVAILARLEDRLERTLWTALFALQSHMVARIDDAVKLRKEHLKPHPTFRYCMQCRLPWSKNVRDRREAPWQIMVASNDPHLCVLLRMGLFLEVSGERPAYQKGQFVFCEEGETPKQVKKAGSNRMREFVVKDAEFKEIFPRTLRGVQAEMEQGSKKLGSHSIRKHAKTKARRKQLTDDDVDTRGRWKGGKSGKASAVYEDTYLPVPDAEVAFALCYEGPVRYTIVEGTGVSDDWIAREVAPNIATVYGTFTAATLGTAILWACLDPEAKSLVDSAIRMRVTQAYELLRHNLDGDGGSDDGTPRANPVVKQRLILHERRGLAAIEPGEIIGGAAGGGPPPAGGPAPAPAAANARVNALENRVDDVRAEMNNLRNEQRQAFQRQAAEQRKQYRLIRRMANFPLVHRRGANANEEAADEAAREEDGGGDEDAEVLDPHATLSKGPRDLHALWDEYENGIGHRKAARRFNKWEKGRCTSIYSKRNHVWRLIKRLVRERDVHSRVAIDMIYAAYGSSTSVTKIIKAIQRDKNTGGHPNLR